MSRHRNLICDICSEPIIGEYVRITVRNSARTRPFRCRRTAIDVCGDCYAIMIDSVMQPDDCDDVEGVQYA